MESSPRPRVRRDLGVASSHRRSRTVCVKTRAQGSSPRSLFRSLTALALGLVMAPALHSFETGSP